ncbi:hypothetical protein CC86DRAFT_404779 [Ophiobolus disseminans]|uniref:Uncharacterized protein n=1 Tax=Ophiobolus disseminans TaxID=1469910 RepID=A0A6A7A835_9PLEO|nr:hypothetical protein CC86DRAFT_404779 [Ophiobolus disseminans]
MFDRLRERLKSQTKPPSSPNPISPSLRLTVAPNTQSTRSRTLHKHSTSETHTQQPQTNGTTTQPQSSPPPQQPPSNPRSPPSRVRASEVRYLRTQLQARYALDMQIWNRGHKAKTFARAPIEDKMRRSDALLRDIRAVLRDWDDRACFKDGVEGEAAYETFCEIRRRVEGGGKRDWGREKPWDGRRG